MFIIAETEIDDAVKTASFCCDVHSCKGACCCLEGGRGAPLEDDEVLEIEKAYPVVKQYLDREHLAAIERAGLYEGSPGSFATTCVDNKDCVFVYHDNGVARCSFERAFLEGRSDWQKPLSCHLFPIRIRSHGTERIVYEEIDECRSGREHGAREGVRLYEFLRDPLTRRFGRPWYEAFLKRCTDEPEQGTKALP